MPDRDVASTPRRLPAMTLLLVAIDVAVYAVMFASSPSDHRLEFDLPTLMRFGAIHADALRAGEWWRLLTGAFVHASIDHLVWNMVSLLFIGVYLEARYAALRYLVLYIAAGIASSAASAAWFWQTDVVQMGASGAISGLVGAGAVSAWRMGERGRGFRDRLLIWGLVILVNGVLEGTNNVAHSAGLLSGAALVTAFGRRGRAALTSRATGHVSFEDAPMLACPRCDATNPVGARYCGACGAPLQEPVRP